MYKPKMGKWTLTAEQHEELEKKEWEVIPKARFLDLYRDDFHEEIMHEVFEVFDKSQQVADKFTLLLVGTKTNQ